MKNLLKYFAVNWEATGDNIRAYIAIKCVSMDALANAMYVTKRTIDNWCAARSHPSIDNLLFLAKFFNVDLLDILVTNDQLEGPITEQDYEEAKRIAQNRSGLENHNDLEIDLNFIYREDVISNIIFNEYVKSKYPVTNLSEFLSILHLVEPEFLCSALRRIDGNLAYDNDYVFRQLRFLYDSIEDEKAKKHVKFLKRFCFEYPSVYIIDDQTKLKNKLQKFEEYIEVSMSDEYYENYNIYERQLNTFCKKLNLMLEIKTRIKDLE